MPQITLDAVDAAELAEMLMRYQGHEITAKSRYTHVYTRENGRWRLMSAQGTPVAG